MVAEDPVERTRVFLSYKQELTCFRLGALYLEPTKLAGRCGIQCPYFNRFYL